MTAPTMAAAESLRTVAAGQRVTVRVPATSANLAGGRDPRRVEEVPEKVRAACGAIVDAGELPGLPSTVLDLTGDEPRVLRQGAGRSP